MPATVMFTLIHTIGRYGRARANYVTLPLIPSLLDEPGATAAGRKYLMLPPEYNLPVVPRRGRELALDEPPAPEPRRNGNYGARPRRNGKQLEPLDE
jgi:hypothetical protein